MKMHYILFFPQKRIEYSASSYTIDALYSILSAKKAGCKTVAIYDDFAKNEWDEILKNTDEILIKPS